MFTQASTCFQNWNIKQYMPNSWTSVVEPLPLEIYNQALKLHWLHYQQLPKIPSLANNMRYMFSSFPFQQKAKANSQVFHWVPMWWCNGTPWPMWSPMVSRLRRWWYKKQKQYSQQRPEHSQVWVEVYWKYCVENREEGKNRRTKKTKPLF